MQLEILFRRRVIETELVRLERVKVNFQSSL